MLDEALQILAAAWSGQAAHHRGTHYTADGMRFLPRPVQRPGVPAWVAGFPGKARPLRRAVRYNGFFPGGLERPDQHRCGRRSTIIQRAQELLAGP